MILFIVAAVSFYNLAKRFNKNGWLWAIISALVYIGSQLSLGVIAGLFFISDAELMDMSASVEGGLNIAGIVFAIVCVVGLYYFLKNKWEKEHDKEINQQKGEIDQIGQ